MIDSTFLINDSAKSRGRQALFFDNDVTDEWFYTDPNLNTRPEPMIAMMDAGSRAD